VSQNRFARTNSFDTGDAKLDADMIARKYFEVIVGYRRTRLVRAAG
jgi:hypothetical protein